MKDKIIWGIVGILTIAWVTVSITQEDIAEQYKENTWKELIVNEEDLVSFDEIIKQYNEMKLDMQNFLNWIDCTNYEYDFSDSCSSVVISLKNEIKALDSSIICFSTINSKNDQEKSDINYCIDAMKKEKITTLDFYQKVSWSCNNDCNIDIESIEYNLAMFQAYLNNIE